MENNGGATSATGCYKCGRPGHWSRDCPFSPSNPNPNPNSTSNPNVSQPSFKSGGSFGPPKPLLEKTSEKPKKPPKTRPKLTPDLLLSNDGLGYVLRHFPRSFKFRGRGHEVSDLGKLIELYGQWHKHLIPYYSFQQFVHKVEQVGATRRVRTCLRELRDRVDKGGDPSKLHEPPVEHDSPTCEPAAEEANNLEGISADKIDPPLESHDADDMQEEMFDEIYRTGTEEPFHSSQIQKTGVDHISSLPDKEPDDGARSAIQMTEEQKAQMEVNRLKALERAASRARSSQAA